MEFWRGTAILAWWAAPFVVSRINPPDNPAHLILPADWRVLAFGLLLTLRSEVLARHSDPRLVGRAFCRQPHQPARQSRAPHPPRGLASPRFWLAPHSRRNTSLWARPGPARLRHPTGHRAQRRRGAALQAPLHQIGRGACRERVLGLV